MNVPKSFVPNKECDFKNLKKVKRKEDIETLVIKIEEIWKKKDCSFFKERHFSKDQFNREYKAIKWRDTIDNIEAEYDNDFFCSTLYINIIEYLNEDLLDKDLGNVYEELAVYHCGQNIFSKPCEPRALIVDNYVLFLRSKAYNNRALNRVEKIYQKKFGAKRLLQKDLVLD